MTFPTFFELTQLSLWTIIDMAAFPSELGCHDFFLSAKKQILEEANTLGSEGCRDRRGLLPSPFGWLWHYG